MGGGFASGRGRSVRATYSNFVNKKSSQLET